MPAKSVKPYGEERQGGMHKMQKSSTRGTLRHAMLEPDPEISLKEG